MKASIHNPKLRLIFFLIFGWIIISGYIFFGSDIGITTIADDNPRFKKVVNSENIQRFEIVSRYDNLGVILFQFRPPKHIPSSVIKFRLMEKNNETPIVTTQYRYQDLYNVNPYPIGFPVIESSAGKIYFVDFMHQEKSASLVFHENQPISEIRYVYSKGYLISNSTDKKLDFIFSKITSLITNNSYQQFTFLYSVFALAIVYISSKLQNTTALQSQKLLGLITFFAVLSNIFTNYSDLIYLAEILVLAVFLKKWRLKQQVLVQNAILVFIISIILLLANQMILSELVSIQFILIIIVVIMLYILPDKNNFKYNDQ